MRILMIAPYISSKAHPNLLRNQTGFGYMVHDIAQFVGKKECVDVFLVTAMTPPIEIDNFQIIGNTCWEWLRGFKFRYLREAYLFLRKYTLPIKDKLRICFYFTSMGEIENKLCKYNVVHIHGCGPITEAAIVMCKMKKIPFIVTLHGLNSFENVVSLSPSLKQQEKDFLVKAALEKYPITFISTGNKKTAEEYVKSIISDEIV